MSIFILMIAMKLEGGITMYEFPTMAACEQVRDQWIFEAEKSQQERIRNLNLSFTPTGMGITHPDLNACIEVVQ